MKMKEKWSQFVLAVVLLLTVAKSPRAMASELQPLAIASAPLASAALAGAALAGSLGLAGCIFDRFEIQPPVFMILTALPLWPGLYLSETIAKAIKPYIRNGSKLTRHIIKDLILIIAVGLNGAAYGALLGLPWGGFV